MDSMIHPNTERRFINEIVGYGVFATQFIPRGTIVWTLSHLDTRFTAAEVAAMPRDFYPFMKVYPYIDNNGDFILGCDIDIYCNHSCDPPLHNMGGMDVAIAIRDIQQGEEITYDYATNNILLDLQQCRCQAKNCRGTISSNDMLIYSLEWENVVKNTLPFIKTVKQPLYPFILEKEKFDRIIQGTLDIPAYINFLCPIEIMEKLREILGIQSHYNVLESNG
jgi:hypothetical protein